MTLWYSSTFFVIVWTSNVSEAAVRNVLPFIGFRSRFLTKTFSCCYQFL